MNSNRPSARLFFCLLTFAVLFVFAPQCQRCRAQDDESPAPAQADVDPAIPVDHLKVRLRPLSQEQLDEELGEWMLLLQQKIAEVGDTEIQSMATTDEAAKEDLHKKLVVLRLEESQLAQRIRTIISALEAKGGDVADARLYIDAVTSVGDTTDKTSFWAAAQAEIISWIYRDNGGKLLARRFGIASAIFLVFWLLSRVAGRAAARLLSRYGKVSSLLENFARNTTGGVVFVVGVLMAVSALGVEVGPMMAALGAGGFIVGFALQETLGSFASGLMIMIYRPFDVDDYVAVAGVEGTVKEMSLVATTLLTIDNKVLVIPNTKVWGDIIVNYTGRNLRRIDLVFSIGYTDSIDHAIAILREVAESHDQVLDTPELTVDVLSLDDSWVSIYCRPWVRTTDYWDVKADLIRAVKERFDCDGINIPYPQRDVYLHQVSDAGTA